MIANTFHLPEGWTVCVQGPDADGLMRVLLERREDGELRRSVLFATQAEGIRGDAVREFQDMVGRHGLASSIDT